MILELIFDVIFGLLFIVINLIPNLTFIQLPAEFIVWFANIIVMSAYFFPVSDFFIMIGIWLMVANFHLAWKVLTRLWDALPFT